MLWVFVPWQFVQSLSELICPAMSYCAQERHNAHCNYVIHKMVHAFNVWHCHINHMARIRNKSPNTFRLAWFRIIKQLNSFCRPRGRIRHPQGISFLVNYSIDFPTWCYWRNLLLCKLDSAEQNKKLLEEIAHKVKQTRQS